MKVYVRREDKQIIFPAYFVTAFFLGFSICIFYSAFTMNFIEFLKKGGMDFVIALVFFFFGMILLFYILKPRKKKIAKLIEKKLIGYNNKEVQLMRFKVIGKYNIGAREYVCFTYKTNDLVVDKNYFIYVKESCDRIKKVGNEISNDDLNKEIEKAKKRSSNVDYSTMGLTWVFIGVSMIFSSFILFSILGIIFYPEYRLIYFFIILIFVVPIGIAFYLNKKK